KLLSLADGKITASFPVESGVGPSAFNAIEGAVGPCAFTPDRKVLAVANSAGQAVLLDFAKGTVSPPLKVSGPVRGDRDSVVRACGFRKEGARLFFALGFVRQRNVVWDWRAGKEVDERVPLDVFPDPRFSPDGRYEFKPVQGGVEILDRAIRPPAVFSQR